MQFFCYILLRKCIVQPQLIQPITLFYLTLQMYLQLRFWMKEPKPNREGAGSLSKYKHQKLQRVYGQGSVAYVSFQFSER